MATILPFPAKKAKRDWGLTEEECDAVQAEAYDLMLQGRVTGVSIHEDGQYMCVFAGNGEQYSIGRENGVCYLFDAKGEIVAKSRRFGIVLDTLDVMLPPVSNETA